MTLGRFKFLSFICAFGKFEIKLTKTSNVSGSELSTGKGIAEIKTGNEELIKKNEMGCIFYSGKLAGIKMRFWQMNFEDSRSAPYP